MINVIRVRMKRVILLALSFSFIMLLLHSVYASSCFLSPSGVIKVDLKTGQTDYKNIFLNESICSIDNLKVDSLEGVSFVSKDKANIIFNASNLSPGIYVGRIYSDKNIEDYLPIVFEIDSRDIFFGVNLDVPVDYSEIHSGDKLFALVKLFDLSSAGGTLNGLGPTNVHLYYSIRDFSGKEITSQSDNILVDKQAQLSKTFFLANDSSEGYYVLSVKATYGSSVSGTSYVFRIIKANDKKSDTISLLANFNSLSLSLFLIIVFFLILMVILLVFWMRGNDRLMHQLKSMNSHEMSLNRKIFEEQKHIILKKKGISKDEVSSKINAAVRRVRERQKKRLEELSDLKKKGKKDEMERKLNEWKKEGFNVSPIKYKLDGLSRNEMESKLKEWKKRYNFK